MLLAGLPGGGNPDSASQVASQELLRWLNHISISDDITSLHHCHALALFVRFCHNFLFCAQIDPAEVQWNCFARFLGRNLEGEFWEVNSWGSIFLVASFAGKTRSEKSTPRIRVQNSGVQNEFPEVGPKFGFRRCKIPRAGNFVPDHLCTPMCQTFGEVAIPERERQKQKTGRREKERKRQIEREREERREEKRSRGHREREREKERKERKRERDGEKKRTRSKKGIEREREKKK